MEKTKHILLIDASAVAHQIWHTIEPTSPALEMKVFREQYFRAIYQSILEAGADKVVLACDHRLGYWRHREYAKRYKEITGFCIHEDGTLYIQHDGKHERMLQTEANSWVLTGCRSKDEKALIPKEGWVTGYDNFIESLPVGGAMTSHYTELAMRSIPRYKGKRGKSKWDYKTNKDEWHEYRERLNAELCDALGMLYVNVPLAEADDIAAWVASNKPDHFHLTLVSVDSDWDQLQQYKNTRRFDPIKNEFIEVADPIFALKVKCICGDAGDNIPSCKIPKEGKKGIRYQGVGPEPAMLMIQEGGLMKRATAEGWDDQLKFNVHMIDLTQVPDEVSDEIATCIEKQSPKGSGKLDRFGIPIEEIMQMRAKATIKKLKFSGMPIASGDEEA